MTARRTAAATADFDLAPHWAALERGKEGWDRAPALTRELSGCFTATVGKVVQQARHGLEDVEFVAATHYGTTHVAEVMHEQLRTAGPKWLDPEQFLSYSPHSLVSAAALALGLGGAGATLLGPDAEFQALAHALRRLRSGRAADVVVAAYEAPTAFVAGHHRELVAGEPPMGRVTALLLTREGPGPAVAARSGLDAAAVRRLAQEHGRPVVVERGVLRTLSVAGPPALLVTGGPDRHDAVVTS